MRRIGGVPWIAALIPAVVAVFIATFSTSDFRASGALSLVALTPAGLMLLIIKRKPWSRRGIRRSVIEIAAAGLLGLIFLFLFVGGTPEYMKAQFGWFIGVDDYGPRAIITGPDGYVIVGDDADSRAVIWTSTDGIAWVRAPHDPVLDRLDVGAGFHWADQYVLVAHDDKRGPVVTLVSEDGHHWIRSGVSSTDGTPYSAVVDGESIAVIGASFSNDGLFLHGRNPSELITADPAPRIDTKRDPVGVATRGDGFVAIVNHKSDAVVFTSSNGAEWTESLRIEQATFSSIASFSGGYFVVGSHRHTDQPAIWNSVDGLSWNEFPIPAGSGKVRLDLIRGDSGRLLLVGDPDDGETARLWWSEDGLAWDALSWPGDGTLIRDVVIRGDTVIVAGVDRTLDSAVIWSGNLEGQWTRVPHDAILFAVR